MTQHTEKAILGVRWHQKAENRRVRVSYCLSHGGNKAIVFVLYDELLSRMNWSIGDKVFPVIDAGRITLSLAYYGIKEKCYTLSKYGSSKTGRMIVTLNNDAIRELKKYRIPCVIEKYTIDSERAISFSLERLVKESEVSDDRKTTPSRKRAATSGVEYNLVMGKLCSHEQAKHICIFEKDRRKGR